MIIHVIQLNAVSSKDTLLFLGLTADKVLDDVKEEILPRVEESEQAEELKCLWNIEGLKEWFIENFAFYEVEYFTRELK